MGRRRGESKFLGRAQLVFSPVSRYGDVLGSDREVDRGISHRFDGLADAFGVVAN